MNKRTYILFILLASFVFIYLFNPGHIVYAAGSCEQQFTFPKSPIVYTESSLTYYFILSDSADKNGYYTVKADNGIDSGQLLGLKDYIATPFKPVLDQQFGKYVIKGVIDKNNWPRQFAIMDKTGNLVPGYTNHTLTLYRLVDQPGPPLPVDSPPSGNQLTVSQCDVLPYYFYVGPTPTPPRFDCTINTNNTKLDEDDPISVNVAIPEILPFFITGYTGTLTAKTLPGLMDIKDPKHWKLYEVFGPTWQDTWNFGAFSPPGSYVIDFVISQNPPYYQEVGKCSLILNIAKRGEQGSTSVITPTVTQPPVPTESQACVYCTSGDCNLERGEPKFYCRNCNVCLPPTQAPVANLKPLCDQIGQSDPGSDCNKCVKSPDNGGKGGIWTAIGCVPTDVPSIVTKFVLGAPGLGIAGGVAFLYFLYGAFLVLTSMGNPEKINQGKEIMTSSIAGLLLILFSVFILKVVAVDIFKIPGFGGK